MQGTALNRYTLLGLVLICYFLPLSAFSAYISHALNLGGISFVAIGLLIALLGSLLLFTFLQQWEQYTLHVLNDSIALTTAHTANSNESTPGNGETAQALIQTKDALTDLQQKWLSQESTLNKREQELYLLAREKERFQRQTEGVLQDFAEYKNSSEEQLHQKEIFIAELQQTLAEQRAASEKKQQQVSLLEDKVAELRYEIRTLLQLAEGGPSGGGYGGGEQQMSRPRMAIPAFNSQQPSSPSNEEAPDQLRRCIDIAEKMTGVPHFIQGNKRFADLPINPFSLDLRRLCDSLANESPAAVLLYSLREKLLLFAHPQIRQISGWSPEKFIQCFDEIISPCAEEWQRALSQLSYRHETALCLRLQGKEQEIIDCESLMALIPSGVFRNYVMILLQPAEELLSTQQSSA